MYQQFEIGQKVRVKHDAHKAFDPYGIMAHWRGQIMTIRDFTGLDYYMEEDQEETNCNSKPGWVWDPDNLEEIPPWELCDSVKVDGEQLCDFL